MHHPGFMRDIIENPDDDAPRLIYADWLQEQGRAERAELIRLQCAMAALPRYDPARRAIGPRAASLQRKFERRWRSEHGLEALSGTNFYFERGFINGIRFYSPGQFLEMAEEVYQRMPLSWIELASTWEEGGKLPTQFVAMLQSPFFSHIRRLDMPEYVEETDLRCFNELASPLSLQGLYLQGCEISSEALMVLSSIQTLSHLEILNLNEHHYLVAVQKQFRTLGSVASLFHCMGLENQSWLGNQVTSVDAPPVWRAWSLKLKSIANSTCYWIGSTSNKDVGWRPGKR